MLESMGRDEMRAGDADRQAVADRLKAALDEGRLDLNEYDERLQKTYAAKTYADLDGLLDDLPGAVPPQRSQMAAYQAPQPPTAPPAPEPVEHQHNAMSWIGPYGGVVAVCILIWAISSVTSGHLTYFWPVWMLIPLILGIFGRAAGHGGGSDRDARRAARRDRRRYR
jgi:uncharacterized integral membrane protein